LAGGLFWGKTHISSAEEPPSTLVSISFLPFLALTIFPFATATRSSAGQKRKAVGYSPLKDPHTRRFGSQERKKRRKTFHYGAPGAGDPLILIPLRWVLRRGAAPAELDNRGLNVARWIANFQSVLFNRGNSAHKHVGLVGGGRESRGSQCDRAWD